MHGVTIVINTLMMVTDSLKGVPTPNRSLPFLLLEVVDFFNFLVSALDTLVHNAVTLVWGSLRLAPIIYMQDIMISTNFQALLIYHVCADGKRHCMHYINTCTDMMIYQVSVGKADCSTNRHWNQTNTDVCSCGWTGVCTRH